MGYLYLTFSGRVQQSVGPVHVSLRVQTTIFLTDQWRRQDLARGGAQNDMDIT